MGPSTGVCPLAFGGVLFRQIVPVFYDLAILEAEDIEEHLGAIQVSFRLCKDVVPVLEGSYDRDRALLRRQIAYEILDTRYARVGCRIVVYEVLGIDVPGCKGSIPVPDALKQGIALPMSSPGFPAAMAAATAAKLNAIVRAAMLMRVRFIIWFPSFSLHLS